MPKFVDTIKIVSQTFPAATLSGAPKHKAIELIDEIERESRAFYGGAIGYIGPKKQYEHAILIRSILSANGRLFYQAGAGIVEASNLEGELQEIDNKLILIREAISEQIGGTYEVDTNH